MHAVECTLDGHVDILLVNLAVGSSVLGIANTCSVIAPSRVSTIIRTSPQTATLATPARLTPARAIKTESVVRAVVDANGNRAVCTTEVWWTNTAAVLTETVSTAIVRAQLH